MPFAGNQTGTHNQCFPRPTVPRPRLIEVPQKVPKALPVAHGGSPRTLSQRQRVPPAQVSFNGVRAQRFTVTAQPQTRLFATAVGEREAVEAVFRDNGRASESGQRHPLGIKQRTAFLVGVSLQRSSVTGLHCPHFRPAYCKKQKRSLAHRTTCDPSEKSTGGGRRALSSAREAGTRNTLTNFECHTKDLQKFLC